MASDFYFLRALAIREKALGPNDTRVADVLNNLALAYLKAADYARAEPVLQRVLAINEKALGPDDPSIAGDYNNLGGLYLETGDYVRAEAMFERALAIHEKALGRNHSALAEYLGNLAELYREKGDYARAVPLAQRALEIREKAFGPDHPAVADSLNNLGLLCKSNGDDKCALSLLQRTLAIREKFLGAEHPQTAATLHNLGLFHLDRGEYAAAAPFFERAMAIKGKALGPEHPLLATTLTALAEVHFQGKDHARAEPLLQRALTIQEKTLGSNHPEVANTYGQMVSHFLARGRVFEALGAARRATDIQDRNARIALAAGSEGQKLVYMNKLVGQPYQVSLHLQHAPTSIDAAHLAVTALLRRKGRVLEAMTDNLAGLRRSIEPADRALVDDLTSVYSQLATFLARGPGRTSVEQYRKTITALEDQRQKLEADIGKRNPAFRVEKSLLTIADVQAAIPRGAALVEVARYETIQFHTAKDPRPKGKPRYAAYVLHPTGNPTFADLGDAAPIESAIDALRRALSDPDLSHDPKPAARALDRLLMQPIRKLLGDTRWVFVSADGAAHLVPFAALVDENEHYLVERYLFSYLNTGRTRELMQGYYQRMKAGAGRSEAMRSVQLAMLENSNTAHPNLWASFIVAGDWRALEGAAVPPDLTVHPGPRGCACQHAGAAWETHSSWLTLLLVLAATLRRRKAR